MKKGGIPLENIIYISIKNLNKGGFLRNGYHTGTITYYNGFVVRVELDTEELYINLKYLISEKEYYYSFKLVKTKCNYGGYRYYFECPAKKVKVTKLYLPNGLDTFGSRQEYNLCYKQELIGKKERIYKKMIDITDTGRLKENIKYTYRNGKPTRKYKKYLKIMKQISILDNTNIL